MSYEEPRVAADLRRSPAPPTDANGAHPFDADLAPTWDGTAAQPGEAPAESVPTAEARKGRGGARAIREVVETLLLALVIFVGVRLVVLNFRVDGNSMIPNLHDQEMLLVNRNVYFHFDLNRALNWIPGVDREGENIVYPFHPPERGDIVVFDPPVRNSDKPYIKRVIGLPGETVEVIDGYVYIDGDRLVEPYIEGPITGCGTTDDCEAFTVPEESVFVLGDNRENSQDSRSFEEVPVDAIIGKAWVTYWPFDDIGLVPHYDYPGISDD